MRATLRFSLIACLLAPMTGVAAIVTFDDEATFLGSVSMSQTVDFESSAPLTRIPSGGVLGGITFTYSIFDPDQLIVDAHFDTTSGTRYLGLEDGQDNLLLGGDVFTMSFAAPVRALGMYFMTDAPLLAGDIRLVTAQGEAANTDKFTFLADTGRAYFVGLLSSTPFSTASTAFGPTVTSASFAFGVDDITTGMVPEPPTWVLLFPGIAVMALRCRSRSRRQRGVAGCVHGVALTDRTERRTALWQTPASTGFARPANSAGGTWSERLWANVTEVR